MPILIRQVAEAYQGTLLVQGKRSYTFTLKDGRKVKGSDLVKVDNWAWSYSLHAPGCRYVRLRARSRTYGQVVLVVVDKPFFFQAEDGIRYLTVTGVQTCALPI